MSIKMEWLDHQIALKERYFAKPTRCAPDIKGVLENFSIADRYEAIADVGCGPQPIFRDERFKAGFYSPIDPLYHVFEQSGLWPQTKYDRRFDYVQQCPPQFFDCIFCLETINYVDDPDRLVVGLHRIVEDGCVLFLTCNFADKNAYLKADKHETVATLSSYFHPTTIKFVKDKLYFSGLKRGEFYG